MRVCERSLLLLDEEAKLGTRGVLMLVRQTFCGATATINRNKRGERNL